MCARKIATSSAKAAMYIMLPVAALLWGPTLGRRALRLPVREERLLIGITIHDLNEVRAALAEGADPNALLLNERQAALSVAVLSAPEPIITELLSAGADVSFADELGVTALFRAAMCGRGDIVEVLLRAGADPNQTSRFRPLNAAALYGHEQTVRLLLDAGADVHARGFGGQTALHDAAINGYSSVIRLLLSAGADITAVNDDGQTARMIAAGNGYDELAAMLRKRMQADVTVVKSARFLPGC